MASDIGHNAGGYRLDKTMATTSLRSQRYTALVEAVGSQLANAKQVLIQRR